MYYKMLINDYGEVRGSVEIMDVGESLVFMDALRRFAEDEAVHEKDRKTATSMLAEIKKEEGKRGEV